MRVALMDSCAPATCVKRARARNSCSSSQRGVRESLPFRFTCRNSDKCPAHARPTTCRRDFFGAVAGSVAVLCAWYIVEHNSSSRASTKHVRWLTSQLVRKDTLLPRGGLSVCARPQSRFACNFVHLPQDEQDEFLFGREPGEKVSGARAARTALRRPTCRNPERAA